MHHFNIAHFNDPERFLPLVARKLGRLKQGGIPDVEAAAKHVLNEWNCGKLRYFTQVPGVEETSNQHMISSEVVTTMAQEFDLDALEGDIKVLIDGFFFKLFLWFILVLDLPEAEMNVDQPKRPLLNVQNEDDQDDAMEEDEPSSSDPLNKDVVIQPKLKLPKINPVKLQKYFDKTRGHDGNISLNRVNKLIKKQKKKQRKLSRKVDNIADLFGTMGQEQVKLEDQDDWFGFLKPTE